MSFVVHMEERYYYNTDKKKYFYVSEYTKNQCIKIIMYLFVFVLFFLVGFSFPVNITTKSCLFCLFLSLFWKAKPLFRFSQMANNRCLLVKETNDYFKY